MRKSETVFCHLPQFRPSGVQNTAAGLKNKIESQQKRAKKLDLLLFRIGWQFELGWILVAIKIVDD